MQETWLQSLIWEDPHAMEQLSLCTITTEACTLQLESCLHSQLEKSLCSKEDPAQPKIKVIIKKAQDHDNRELNQVWDPYKEKAMAPHSSPLAWKIPWMEEPGGLQSMGSQRVGHD